MEGASPGKQLENFGIRGTDGRTGLETLTQARVWCSGRVFTIVRCTYPTASIVCYFKQRSAQVSPSCSSS